MSNYSPPDDDDLIFFREAMKSVKRLKAPALLKASVKKTSTVRQFNKAPQSSRRKKCQLVSDSPFLPLILSDPLEQSVAAEDKLFFKRQGPQNKVIKQLIRGELICSACLDLHGMTISQARSALAEFLQASQRSAFRCVQIIHGKGRLAGHDEAKLKNHVNYWLPQIACVLAFSSAQPRHGGRGAVYVLLAKP
jgi:DNA-nicking Smr family endonuclease